MEGETVESLVLGGLGLGRPVERQHHLRLGYRRVVGEAPQAAVLPHQQEVAAAGNLGQPQWVDEGEIRERVRRGPAGGRTWCGDRKDTVEIGANRLGSVQTAGLGLQTRGKKKSCHQKSYQSLTCSNRVGNRVVHEQMQFFRV